MYEVLLTENHETEGIYKGDTKLIWSYGFELKGLNQLKNSNQEKFDELIDWILLNRIHWHDGEYISIIEDGQMVEIFGKWIELTQNISGLVMK